MIAGGLRRLLPQRMRENIDVFDFALTDDESARITTLDTGAQLRVRPPRPRLTSVSGRPAAPPAPPLLGEPPRPPPPRRPQGPLPGDCAAACTRCASPAPTDRFPPALR